jgi:hypothetical protein
MENKEFSKKLEERARSREANELLAIFTSIGKTLQL